MARECHVGPSRFAVGRTVRAVAARTAGPEVARMTWDVVGRCGGSAGATDHVGEEQLLAVAVRPDYVQRSIWALALGRLPGVRGDPPAEAAEPSPPEVTLGAADSTPSEDRIGLSPSHARLAEPLLGSHHAPGEAVPARARLGGCEPVAAAASPGGPIALGRSAVSAREGDEPISSHARQSPQYVSLPTVTGLVPQPLQLWTSVTPEATSDDVQASAYAASCRLPSPPSSVCVR